VQRSLQRVEETAVGNMACPPRSSETREITLGESTTDLLRDGEFFKFFDVFKGRELIRANVISKMHTLQNFRLLEMEKISFIIHNPGNILKSTERMRLYAENSKIKNFFHCIFKAVSRASESDIDLIVFPEKNLKKCLFELTKDGETELSDQRLKIFQENILRDLGANGFSEDTNKRANDPYILVKDLPYPCLRKDKSGKV
jgi:hypothetical protein